MKTHAEFLKALEKLKVKIEERTKCCGDIEINIDLNNELFPCAKVIYSYDDEKDEEKYTLIILTTFSKVKLKRVTDAKRVYNIIKALKDYYKK